MARPPVQYGSGIVCHGHHRQSGYLPGMPVAVSGAGWLPGETVNLVFHETNGPDDDVTFQAIADDAGNISNSKFAPDSHDYGVIFTLTATGVSSSLTAQTMFTDGANLDSCANGKATAHTDCEWVNGNLNDTKSHYLEGDSVPFRLVIDGLSIGTHTATIAFDSTKGGKHAFDYLTSYNRTMNGLNPPSTANPCLGIATCAGPSTFPIPTDANVTGAGVPQIPGVFSIFNGAISSISPYTFSSGTFAGDSTEQLTLTFTASSPTVVLAWAAHVSTRLDWTSPLSAIFITGAPYHMRLFAVDGSGGNQDHQIQAAPVTFPASITIKKHATPQSSQAFSFTGSPAPLTGFPWWMTASRRRMRQRLSQESPRLRPTTLPKQASLDGRSTRSLVSTMISAAGHFPDLRTSPLAPSALTLPKARQFNATTSTNNCLRT